MDERIQKIVERWYITEPAFFQIFCTHNLEKNNSMSCPFRCGKGKIEYNPDIINSLNDRILQSYLKAEVLRILLKHPYERQPDGCKRESMSVGSNLVLADNYDFHDIHLPKPGDYNLQSSESYEWYSYRIEELEPASSQQQSTQDNNENDGSDDGIGESNEDGNEQSDPIGKENNDGNENTEMNRSNDASEGHNTKSEGENSISEIQLPDGSIIKIPNTQNNDNNSNNSSNQNTNSDSSSEREVEQRVFSQTNSNNDLSQLWEEDPLMSCSIDVAIDEIEATNSWGSLAGNFASKIVANTKAKIDYRKVLSGFRASVLSSKRRLTRMRPNRRTGFDNMGSIRRFNTNILIAVDVSGSIMDASLCHFYSIIRRAFKYGVEKLDVVQFDTELGEIESLDKASLKVNKEIKIFGRGGTSFQPVFDYVASHPKYDGLIIFTDGQAPIPIISKKSHCKYFWVCDSKKHYEENKEWMQNIGRCCAIEL